MKTTSILFSFFFLGLFLLMSNQDGAFPGNTGAPGEFTCGRAPCHNIPVNIGSSSIQIDINDGDSTYQAGLEHEITVSISNTSSEKHGFQILALDAQNNNVGNWIITEPENMKIIESFSPPTRFYVTHTAAGNQLTSWTMNWEAPPAEAGDITFYSSVLVANNNGTNMGDSLYNTSKIIQFEEMVSTTEVAETFQLHLYPNPASEFLFIENKNQEELTIRIYDSNGRIFMEDFIKDKTHSIDVKNWEKGVYHLLCLNKKKSYTFVHY